MLKGKAVLVTGAAKGIGRAIALEFAKEGCNILLNYRSTVSQDLIDEIEGLGVKCLAVQGDVSDFETAKAVVSQCKEQLGSLDVLVNNAGITRDMLLLRMTEEEFDSVIQTNLKGSFNMLRHSANIMLKQKSGAIINMSSVIGLIGNMGQVNYAASKAGIIGMTKSAARELGGRGITVNAIAPGAIDTDMTSTLNEDVKKQMLANIPLKRFGSTEDVARAAVFLAKNRYITGQVLNVDGGMVMY